MSQGFNVASLEDQELKLENQFKERNRIYDVVEEINRQYPVKRIGLLIVAGTVASLSILSSSMPAMAALTPSALVQAGYWYGDEDIRAVLSTRVGDRAYVAPALPFESRELLTDIVTSAVAEAREKGAALIPVNFSNAHWAALAIKSDESGALKVIYNDSLGGAIASRGNGALLAEVLREINPNIEIIDLQLVQQSDGSSCGAFTAENLAIIADLDASDLSAERLKEILGKLNNAALIRAGHFKILLNGGESVDPVVLKPVATMKASLVKEHNSQLMANIGRVTSLNYDRLSSLNRISPSGVASSSDDALEHGAWAKGFAGSVKQNFKGSDNSSSRLKAKLHGFVVGADTKLDDNTTIGLSYSDISSKAKASENNISTGTANISSNIFSLYGSSNIDDHISLSGNVSYGNAVIKNKEVAGKNTKRKGQLAGGSLQLEYDHAANDYLVITPNLGMDYSQLKIKSYSDGSLKFGKTLEQQLGMFAGVRLSSFFDASRFTIIPELKGEYRHPLWQKGGTLKISNQLNQTILTQQNKSSKTGSYTLGGTINLIGDVLELSGGWEHIWQGSGQSDKSLAHLGWVKVRVNF